MNVKTRTIWSWGIFALTFLCTQQMTAQPQVKTGTLSNGFHYYILPDTKAEEIYLELVVRGGSRAEFKEEWELAHAIEHLGFRKSKHFENIWQFLESKGFSGGSHFNASTSSDWTNFRIKIPITQKQLLPEMMLVISDMASGLILDSANIELERYTVLNEIGLPVDPSVADKSVYLDWNGGRTVNENCLNLKNFSHQSLLNYHNRWYQPEHEAIIVHGNVNVESTEKEIQKFFGGVLSSAKSPGKPAPIDLRFVKDTLSFRETVAAGMYKFLIMQRHFLPMFKLFKKEDYLKQVRVDLFNEIVKDRAKRLASVHDWEPEQWNMIFMQSGNYFTQQPGEGLFSSFMIPAPWSQDVTASAMKQFFLEERRLATQGFIAEEFSVAAKRVRENWLQKKTGAKAHAMIDACRDNFVFGVKILSPDEEYKTKTIFLNQLTLTQFNKTVQEWFNFGTPSLTISTNELSKPASPTEKQVMQWKDSIRLVTLTPLPKGPLAKLELMPDSIKQRINKTVGRYTEEKWPALGARVINVNGMRLVMRPSGPPKEKGGTLQLKGVKPIAPFQDYDEYVAAALSANAASRSGVGTLSANRRKELYAASGVRLGTLMEIDEAAFAEQGNDVSRAGLTTMAQLLYMALTQPKIDENIVAGNALNVHSNISLPKMAGDSVMANYKGYPVNRKPLTKAPDIFTPEFARAAIRKYYSNLSGFTIIATGDYDADSLLSVFIPYLSALPSKTETATIPEVKADTVARLYAFVRKAGTMQYVTIRNFIPATFTFRDQVEQRMLSEALDKIVWKKIRGEMGAAYSAFAYNMGVGKHMLGNTIFFDTNWDDLEGLIKTAVDQMKSLKSEVISKELLDTIRAAVKQQFESEMTSNVAWNDHIYRGIKYGVSWEELGKIANWNAEILRVTPERIQELANQYYPDLNIQMVEEFE